MQLLRKGGRRALRQLWHSRLGDGKAPFSASTGCKQQWQDSKGYSHFKRPGPSSASPDRVTVLAAGVLGLGGLAYYNTLQEIPYTHRKHSVLVSVRMERSLGARAFEQIKEQAAQNRTLFPHYHPDVRRIERIGRRIVQSALQGKGGGFAEHMQNLDWEFIVVGQEDPNAMVMPGGKVVVHSGLLDLMRDDDEIGAVLGHEVAHVIARHVAEKLSQAQLFELLRTLIFWTIGIPIPLGAAELAIFLPNSRKLETEADIIGMQIAAQSCFDPSAAISVFRKLGEFERQSSASAVPGFLRTHPLTDKRVKRVEEEVPAARQAYELSGCATKRSNLASLFYQMR